MSDKDKFEEKLREKLESYQAPYNPNHWDAYRRSYSPNAWQNFSRSWYLPYLFSALLFGMLWYFTSSPAEYGLANGPATRTTDTIYVKETIRIYDTLVIRDTIYIKQKSPNVLPLINESTLVAEAKNPLNLKTKTVQEDNYANTKTDAKTDNREPKPSRNQAKPIIVRNTEQESANQTISQALPVITNDSMNGAKNSSLNKKSSPPPSQNVASAKLDSNNSSKPEAKESYEQEEAIYINKGPSILSSLWQKTGESIKSQDYRLLIGPQVNLFSPWNYKNIDTYGGVFGGFGAILSVNKIELHAGLQYGLMHHEYSSIIEIDANQRLNFPNYSTLTPSPDYIEIFTQHLHLPLQLSYVTWQKENWHLRSKAGILGSMMLRENFEYSYIDTNIDDIEDVNSSFRSQGLMLSHANLGFSIAYSYQRKWQIEMALQYYHPLNQSGGNSKLNTNALALQVGWYWSLF